MNQLVTPVVLAAVGSEEGSLFIKRAKPPFVGHWGLLGGKIHSGEHIDAAAIREVMEESGLQTRFTRYCGRVSELVYEGDRLAHSYLLHVVQLEAAASEVTSTDEGVVKWFNHDDIDRYEVELVPSDRLMLERMVLSKDPVAYFRCVVRSANGRYKVVSFE